MLPPFMRRRGDRNRPQPGHQAPPTPQPDDAPPATPQTGDESGLGGATTTDACLPPPLSVAGEEERADEMDCEITPVYDANMMLHLSTPFGADDAAANGWVVAPNGGTPPLVSSKSLDATSSRSHPNDLAHSSRSWKSETASTMMVRDFAIKQMAEEGRSAISTERYLVPKDTKSRDVDLKSSVLQFSPYAAREDGAERDDALHESWRAHAPALSLDSGRAVGAWGEAGGMATLPENGNPAVNSMDRHGALTKQSNSSMCINLRPLLSNKNEEMHGVPPHLHGAPSLEKSESALRTFQDMDRYVSQSFEPSDTQVDRTAALNLTRNHHIVSDALSWLITMSIGVAMGVVAFVVKIVIEMLSDVRRSTTEQLIAKGNTEGAIEFYILIALGLSAAAAVPVAFYAPLAAGSGITEMKVYMNGIHIPQLLKLKTFLVKCFSLCLVVPAGLVIGITGPFIHLGGIVGGGIGSLGSNAFDWKLPGKRPLNFLTPNGHRNFIAIGIAAGIAAIYIAPIGGVLMAYEDCGSLSYGTTKSFWQSFLATCAAVYVGYLLDLFLLDAGNGSVMYDGTGLKRSFALYDDSLINFSVVFSWAWWEVLVFALMGMGSGLLGTIFVRLHVAVNLFRKRYLMKPGLRLLEVLVLSVLTNGIAMLACYYSPCDPLPSDIATYPMTVSANASDGSQFFQNKNFPQMWCSQGTYSVYGSLYFDPVGTSSVRVMHLGESELRASLESHQFPIPLLVSFFVTSYLLLVLTYSSSIPGGILLPSLGFGAAYGRLIAKIVDLVVVRNPNLPSFASYAVVGAACMLSGITRMTMSITVLVLETTGSLQLTIPMMVAVFFAKFVGDLTGIGIYDAYIKLKGVPYLPEEAMSYKNRMVRDKLDIDEVMTAELTCFPPVVKVRRIIDVLSKCKHDTFPVAYPRGAARHKAHRHGHGQQGQDGRPAYEILGTLGRNQLVNMLSQRMGFLKPGETRFELPETKEVMGLKEACELYPLKGKGQNLDAAVETLSAKDLDLRVDLRPFMQLDPYIISSGVNVSKAFRLFHRMGLNQIYVAPKCPQPVVGIVTRKDLTIQNCLLQLGERARNEMEILNSFTTVETSLNDASLKVA